MKDDMKRCANSFCLKIMYGYQHNFQNAYCCEDCEQEVTHYYAVNNIVKRKPADYKLFVRKELRAVA